MPAPRSGRAPDNSRTPRSQKGTARRGTQQRQTALRVHRSAPGPSRPILRNHRARCRRRVPRTVAVTAFTAKAAKTRRPQPGVTRMPASRVVQKPTLITLGPNRTPRDIATVRRCSPFFILEAHRHSLRAGSRSAMLAPRLGRVLQQHDTDVAETADAEGRRNRNSNNKSTALPPRREDAGRSDSSVASSRLRGLRGKAVPQL